MELYITKKLTDISEFSIDTIKNNELPYMHILTPIVELKNDINNNLYIASSEDPNFINNLVKIKKLIIKQQFPDETKIKLTDDITWLKPSPILKYKADSNKMYFNKVLTGLPMKLQLVCNSNNITVYDTPYSSYNLHWTIDTIILNNDFDLNILQKI